MSDRGSDFGSRRDRRRRYSSESEDDDRRRKDRAGRRRSLDRPQFGDSHRRRFRDDSRRSDDRRTTTHRSRSPRQDRRREHKSHAPRRSSPIPRPRSPRDNHRFSSARDHNASHSPPPKRRRPDSRDARRRSSYHDAHRRRRESSSPSLPRRRHSPPPPSKRSTVPLPSQQAAFSTNAPQPPSSSAPPPEEKQKPNYAPTGKLAAETNTVAHTAIVLKYHEPPEARLPSSASSSWRLYVFKGPELLDTVALHERSCWLFGRERAVVDFPVEHPSCSKQHAVLQFRYTERRKKEDEWGGSKEGSVRPYVIDLESANGTRVNGEGVPARRFVEVRSGDVVTFGESTREYVLMLPPKDLPKA